MCGRSLWSLFSATSYILVLLFWRHIYDGVVSPNPFKRFAIFVRQNIIWVTRKSCFHGVKKNTTFVYFLIWNFRSTNKFPDCITITLTFMTELTEWIFDIPIDNFWSPGRVIFIWRKTNCITWFTSPHNSALKCTKLIAKIFFLVTPQIFVYRGIEGLPI